MTSRDRVHVLTRTLPDIRPNTPTWTGENHGNTLYIAGLSIDETRSLYRQGSYHELERILNAYTRACTWLNRNPNRARHLAGWYWPPVDPHANPAVANQAIDDLTQLMEAVLPGRIRVPHVLRKMWGDGNRFEPAGLTANPVARGTHANEWMLRQRDAKIRELSAMGQTQAAIADRYKLTVQRISQILASQENTEMTCASRDGIGIV